MAPTTDPYIPKALSVRQKRLARIRGDIHPHLPHKTHRPEANVSDAFLSSKRDKRIVKHSGFVSRIQQSRDGVTKPVKRRRPGRKLISNLDALSEALPTLDDDGEEEPDEMGRLKDGKIRHKSLKSRPGALKRKEEVIRGEVARFGASMAALTATPENQVGNGEGSSSSGNNGGMAGGAPPVGEDAAAAAAAAAGAGTGTSNRWALLRRHISGTMEQNPAFTSGGG